MESVYEGGIKLENDTVSYGRGWKVYYTETPNEIFEDKCTLTPTQTVIYLYLLSRVNVKRNGECVAWPSYPTIAKCTRTGERTVQDAIKALIEKLYISKKNRFAEGDNRQLSNMYFINHPSETTDFNP